MKDGPNALGFDYFFGIPASLDFPALSIDLDAYLDQRDSDPFENEWLRVHAEAESHYANDVDDAIRELGKTILLRVSRLTEQHEVTSYIADDFNLVCKALAAGYSDPWLNSLYLQYRAGRLPGPELRPVAGILGDLI